MSLSLFLAPALLAAAAAPPATALGECANGSDPLTPLLFNGSEAAAFGDADGEGDLDLLVGNPSHFLRPGVFPANIVTTGNPSPPPLAGRI